MNKSDIFFFVIVFGMFSIFSIFDIEERGQIALYLLVAGAYLSHHEEKKEKKRIEIVTKQNERLDALELQQYKLRDANMRIAELEKLLGKKIRLNDVKIKSNK